MFAAERRRASHPLSIPTLWVGLWVFCNNRRKLASRKSKKRTFLSFLLCSRGVFCPPSLIMNVNPFVLFFTAFPLGLCWWSRSPAAIRDSLATPDGLSSLDTSSVFEGRRSPSRVRRKSERNVKHLELLVVVGPDVYQFHQEDTERYILTILNIAAELLRDASLGIQFRVHLIGMIVLTEPESSIRLSSNITDSVISVCEWSRSVHPENDSDPRHADLVLYVTRFDLELRDGNKQVHGVTQLGGACSTFWSCIITEDTGFGLGVTIAHEIGHSFGIQHDGEGNPCPSSGHIMGSAGGHNSVDVTWSSCSREQLLAFISTGQASCVDDLPDFMETIPGRKPGLYYGLDEQCKIAFGEAATACTFTRHDLDMCKALSCHTNPADQSSCTRRFYPLLDGTECGLNKWCSKGRCSSSDDLDPIHGQWSSWTAFTSCSRSCGGGVTARRRQCNNPRPAFGGHPCEGKDVEAELCNTQPCLTTQKDFMDEQCAETDSTPLQIDFAPEYLSFYKWISALGHVKGDLMCKHMCQASGKNFMVRRGDRFIDGTRCEPDSLEDGGKPGWCLTGRCKTFGCDGKMDSGKSADACQVCGGDNMTCSHVNGSYTEGKAREYVTFLVLPPNTTTVRVVNRKPLFTHLAVKVGGRYVVAGKGSISYNTTFPSVLEDNQIEYKVFLTEDRLPRWEQVHMTGPLQETAEIQVYRKYGKEYGAITNPDITFSYFRPNKKQAYGWAPQLGPCSVSCGEGVLQVDHSCFDQTTGEATDDSHCLKTPRPAPRRESCLTAPCPPHWVAEDFGPCSATCGGGTRERLVHCAKEDGGRILTLPDSECTEAARPSSVESCNSKLCPPRWKESEPGPCSAVCGVGVASLNVTCVQVRDGLETIVEESFCLADEKPLDVAPCVVNVCPLGWDTKEVPDSASSDPFWPPRIENQPVYIWSPVAGDCTVTCGGGLMLVSYVCLVFDTREEAQEERCNQTRKPSSQLEVCNPMLCPPSWEVKELAPCPVTCGGGRIPLLVRCIRQHGNATKTLPHSKCGRTRRPASSKECATELCPARWFSKKGACSASCGGGVLHKARYCARETGEKKEEEILPDAHCENLPHPEEQEACNPEPCPPRWKVTRTGPCSSSCGLGVATQTIACVQSSGSQEVALADDSCPEAEKPLASLPCVVQECSYEWGFTQWTECSVSCGTGVQMRKDFCLNSQTRARVNPAWCMRTPKPLRVRTCSVAPCFAPASADTTLAGLQRQPTAPGWRTTPSTTPSPARSRSRALGFPQLAVSLKHSKETGWGDPSEEHGVCGRLFLGATGLINMTGLRVRDCAVAIGRPLQEIITLRVLESTLNCTAGEMLLFSTRTMWRTGCKKLGLLVINNTKANTLMVRQRLLVPGNGVVLQYSSQAAPKRYHQDCDVQLFGPRGEIVNPGPPADGESPASCRTFIDVAPRLRIAIRAVNVDLGTDAGQRPSGYILIRDVSAMKTTIFHGNQLFYWESTGSQAEIEFSADLAHVPFRAEYWVTKPK
uniref:A disintegrin and metalloproteinase with thrombospondin motifs 13 isoform X2 n=1 Tax=Pogona vitticeps TaxID=103695 RepID=A0ABM5F5M7_9SAUR